MKQSIHDAEQLMDELEEIRSLLVEKDEATGNLEAYIKQLVVNQEVVYSNSKQETISGGC